MATVTRENIGLLTDKITVNVAKGDYLPSFEKALKNYGKQANIPGFRKGMVPSGLIKKMYGSSVFTDEVLKTVEKELTTYMTNEKLEIFAQPLPLPENDARQIDMAKPDDYAFAFEVGLKPAFSLADLGTASLTRHKVEVTPAMIDEEVERQRTRNGKMTEPETVAGDENALNLQFTETDADGQPIEGGISKDNSLLVKYFNEATRPKWIGLKKDDSLVLQLSTALDEKEREWVLNDLGLPKEDPAAAEKYFRVTITKVGLVEKADLNEEFFKAAAPGKDIKTEEEYRNSVRDEIQAHWDSQSFNQLQHTLYHVLLDNTKIEFPEAFLKRWMQTGGEKPKSQAEVEEEFPSFVNQLKWTLIVDKVVRENNIEVGPDDIREFAKQQLFGYMGMQAGAEEQPWIADYVNRMMQDRKFVEDTVHRIQTDKVFGWAATQIHPTEKVISREEFQHMQEEHQHHHH
ncbi:trigger factor [Flavitalea sp. BT771]|uniref:trigger factor n=1 Tax=Flavitalea sp. BT771 TaxID=3063329 RepID=UPI0026E480B7|nr:trigger factor [Flavitalea sp. BT771]MDO6435601.1 trigger factor [Flavitalea sp. BT771]MDV6224501.1 trigger factor [Flavitalea sp. BT771]